MIKVAICDDQEVVCQGLEAILGTAQDLQVLSISNNGQELAESLERKPVDVILMDLKMPILNGIQATKLIKEKFPGIKILVLTTYDADAWLFDAIRNGADGYLLKDTSRENLTKYLREKHLLIQKLQESSLKKLPGRPIQKQQQWARISVNVKCRYYAAFLMVWRMQKFPRNSFYLKGR
jgi:DNA-binding NarL/FixJ family response regulator